MTAWRREGAGLDGGAVGVLRFDRDKGCSAMWEKRPGLWQLQLQVAVAVEVDP